MRKHAKAKKGSAGRSSARSSARSGARSGRKHHKVHKVGMRKSHVSKASGKTAKFAKSGRSRLHKPHSVRPSKPSRAASQSKPQPVASSAFKKAADEVPTLEQVTITCANCGRLFKILKLKGLSLEGTICQRCSLGEMQLPESFG